MSEIINLKKIYTAYLDCRETKRNSASAVEFEFNLEKNLKELFLEVQQRKYEPGKSVCFVVREPKPREVFAACFRDRIVHHLLVNELHNAGERIFISDSYACRINKGTHKAVRKLRDFLKTNKGRRLHFLQLDIDSFFMSIDKIILENLVKKIIEKQNKSSVWKEEAVWLAEKIIQHDPTKNFQMNSPLEFFKLISDRKSLFKQPKTRGLPIGNYTSQFFANVYLNELDQFVKRDLKCRRYVRYVDDFILLHNDPAVLRKWMSEIKNFTEKRLKLKISDRKIRMQDMNKGIDFLGYFIKPDYVLARKAVVCRFKKKIKNRENLKITNFKAMIRSYFGHFSHADCRSLIKKYAIHLE